MNDLKLEYLNDLKLQGLAEGTIRCREIYIRQFLQFLQKQKAKEISKEIVFSFQLHLSKQNIKPLTYSHKLSVLCCFLKWLYLQGHLFSDLSKLIQFPKRNLILPKSILSETEINRFLALPDVNTAKGIRDKAMLELFYSTAIRRSELANMQLYDVKRDEGFVNVTGKGGKQRIVPVGSVALYWIDLYLKEVRNQLNIKLPWLFVGLRDGKRLNKENVSMLIRSYWQQSGLSKKVSPHIFRHSCATHLLKRGADIRYIQKMLGHESCETTQIYTHVEISDLQAVYAKAHPRAKNC